MNIQTAVLCDAATDDNGKLNLLGAFDTIYARELPAIHPQCAVALRVTFLAGDEGKRQLKLNFVDADGRSIMPPIEIPVEVALPDDMHFGTRNFIIKTGPATAGFKFIFRAIQRRIALPTYIGPRFFVMFIFAGKRPFGSFMNNYPFFFGCQFI